MLDADITGPSMPRFFGVNGKRAGIEQIDQDNFKYNPVESEGNIKIMSMNLMMPKEDEPVIWRGPVVTSVLTQLFTDTKWGELDYLLIDMPPGTSDINFNGNAKLPYR